MYRIICLFLAIMLLSATMTMAEEKKDNKISGIVSDTVETTKKITKDTLETTRDVTKDTISTAVGVTKKTLSKVKSVTQKTVSKARDVTKKAMSKTKELSGMSIVGNDEAPKSLYIVPWKSSELGVETSMNMMLNEADVPVDKEVFKREVNFYSISTKQ